LVSFHLGVFGFPTLWMRAESGRSHHLNNPDGGRPVSERDGGIAEDELHAMIIFLSQVMTPVRCVFFRAGINGFLPPKAATPSETHHDYANVLLAAAVPEEEEAF
jgi:hypothetical protein